MYIQLYTYMYIYNIYIYICIYVYVYVYILIPNHIMIMTYTFYILHSVHPMGGISLANTFSLILCSSNDRLVWRRPCILQLMAVENYCD